MGGGASQVSNESAKLIDIFNALQIEKMSEDAIWQQLSVVPGTRDPSSLFSMTICHAVAKVVTKKPENIINFLLVCVKFLTKVASKGREHIDIYFVLMIAAVATVCFAVLNIDSYYVLTFSKIEDVFYDLEKVLPKLLKAPGIGCSPTTEFWCEQEETDHVVNESARLQVLKLYLLCLNIGKFRSTDSERFEGICTDEFPLEWFVTSVCNESRVFIDDVKRNKVTQPRESIVRCSFTVFAQLMLTDANLKDAIAKCPTQVLLSAFFGSRYERSATPLAFNTTSSFTTEMLTFFYIALLNNPEFAVALPCSNEVVVSLLNSMQVTLEFSGVSFIHSLIVSILMLIINNQQNAEKLDSVEAYQLTCQLRPHRGSLADLVIEILLQFADNPALLKPIACLFHMVTQGVKEYSMFSATGIMKVFCSLSNVVKGSKQVQIARVFCEIFANVVQAQPITNTNFAVVIARHASLFKRLRDVSANLAEPIDIILKFTKELARVTKETGQSPSITADKASELVAKIQTDKIYPNPTIYAPRPHVSGGSMAQTWGMWCDALFTRNCSEEFTALAKKLEKP